MSVQRDEEWLEAATAEEITRALDAGELNELLGRSVPAPLPPEGQADAAWLASASLEAVSRAYDTGQLDQLLGRPAADATANE
ncbi:hypothetical protein Ppa06_26320 [Planomonospora parontospora subsp. parontospora]|uniref:Uncharacterized protein n=2 Tax=Planomonospora parontospora TaxID=58119 RepID=A0AA37BEY8_9ACTN|nr:hypothetical protein [Planomonospora parontospora]GGK59951.1 hypothetical protein GCM10010126_19360 [Planomonospora parontospora]GII08834.1 hypothetical protein Ppa06_26320 [Planomonospora parontospora subsp. parontospora]